MNPNEIDIIVKLINNTEGELSKLKGQLKGALDNIPKQAQTANSALRKLVPTFGDIAKGLGVAFGTWQVVRFTKEMVGLGIELDHVKNVFNSLSQIRGFASGDFAGKFASSLGGSVSKLDAFRSANSALVSDLSLTQGQMVELANTARVLGDIMGVKASDAFNTLTYAIASGQTRMLKQIGIFTDLEEAYGGLGDSMTQAQKQSALFNTIMNKTSDLSASFGKNIKDASQQTQSLWASLKNLASSGGEAVLRITHLGDVAEGASKGFQNLANEIDKANRMANPKTVEDKLEANLDKIKKLSEQKNPWLSRVESKQWEDGKTEDSITALWEERKKLIEEQNSKLNTTRYAQLQIITAQQTLNTQLSIGVSSFGLLKPSKDAVSLLADMTSEAKKLNDELYSKAFENRAPFAITSSFLGMSDIFSGETWKEGRALLEEEAEEKRRKAKEKSEQIYDIDREARRASAIRNPRRIIDEAYRSSILGELKPRADFEAQSLSQSGFLPGQSRTFGMMQNVAQSIVSKKELSGEQIQGGLGKNDGIPKLTNAIDQKTKKEGELLKKATDNIIKARDNEQKLIELQTAVKGTLEKHTQQIQFLLNLILKMSGTA